MLNRSYCAALSEPVRRKMVKSSTMGRVEYQRWFESQPAGDGRVEITNTYRVLREGELVREVITTVSPIGLDEQQVLDGVPSDRFCVEEVDENYLVVRRRADLTQ